VCFQKKAFSVATIYAVKSSTASTAKNIIDSDTSETLKNGCRVGFEPKTSDANPKNFCFFQKTGANLVPWVAITPVKGKDITGVFGERLH